MKKYLCVIFDMDGTLTQTNQLIYDSFNHVAEKYIRRRMSSREIIGLFGPPEKECIEMVVGPERVDEAMTDYYAYYHARHNELASIYPGITDVLEFLAARSVILALFTGKGRRTTDITLQQFGIERFFNVTVTGDDVDEFKPSGDGIRKILHRFSLRPDEVLMVGDAVADVTAARDAGVDIASVLWDSYGKDDVLRLTSDYTFHNVGEFSTWIRSLD
jgi:HAD superfamily hydrolase (TIGR01549 family)